MDTGSRSARDTLGPDPARGGGHGAGRRSYYVYSALLILLVACPLVWFARAEWVELSAWKRGDWAYRLLGDIFLAYEAVSGERGPSNSMLLAGAGTEFRLRQERLATARQTTDRRLETLDHKLTGAVCNECAAMRADIAKVRTMLARGREAFDVLYADEARQRKEGEVRDAVNAMFRASIPFDMMLTDAFHMVASQDLASIDLLFLARVAGEFREFAGRFASISTESLVMGRGLNDIEKNDLAVAQGRIDQLIDFLMARTMGAGASPELRAAMSRLKTDYIDTSLAIAMELPRLLPDGGKSQMTPAQLADMYVPGMAAIVAMRVQTYEEAGDVRAEGRQRMERRALAIIGLGVLAEVLVIWVLLRFRGRYVERLEHLSSALSSIYAARPRNFGRESVLSELTHDMKSPQAGIIALLELARTSPAYQSNPELFFRIEGYARRTLKMVDDFVQMNQSLAPVTMSMEVDLHGALLDATDSLAALARSRRIDLQVEESDGDPYIVYGDPELLVRAITNVVENAIKYSPDGASVRCALGRASRWTTLAVSDTGYGIAARDVPHVFKRYRRFRAPGQPRVPGTGLGLAFVKDVVTRMRGRIACQSQLGQGTAFVLRFPRQRAWAERLRRWLKGVDFRFPPPYP